MMRCLILLALMLCLPVRGEAWQVVGGRAESFCTINSGSVICEDFSAPTGWTDIPAITYSTIDNKTCVKITADTTKVTTAGKSYYPMLTTGVAYNWEIKAYIPCSGGSTSGRVYIDNIQVWTGTVTCGSWQTLDGSFTAGSSSDVVQLQDRYSDTGTVRYYTDLKVWAQ